MKKLILALIVAIATGFTSLSYAQETKTITLTDGSNLKGQVVSFENDVYTIETPHLGEIEIDDADILSINAGNALPTQNTPNNDPSSSRDAQLKNQVMQIQSSVMSDPSLMEDIEGLLEDEGIRSILADQNFVNDVMSYDMNKIEQNSNTQELMQNPSIQALMEKINQKVAP